MAQPDLSGKVTVTQMRAACVQYVLDSGVLIRCVGRENRTHFRFLCPICDKKCTSATAHKTSLDAVSRHMQRHTAAELRAWQISQWLCDEPVEDWIPF